MAVGQDLPRNKLHLLDNAVRNIEETCYTHIYLHCILYLLSLSLFFLYSKSLLTVFLSVPFLLSLVSGILVYLL